MIKKNLLFQQNMHILKIIFAGAETFSRVGYLYTIVQSEDMRNNDFIGFGQAVQSQACE